MSQRRFFIVNAWVAASLAWALPNVGHAQSTAKIGESNNGKAGEVVVETNSAIKGVKKVAITQFVVYFSNIEKASSGSGGFGGPQSSSVEVKLANLPEAAKLQAIAQTLYDDTLSELKTAGVDVMPLEELKQKPIWKAISEAGQASPWAAETGLTHSSGGMLVAPHGYRVEMYSGEDSFTLISNNSPKQDRFIAPMSKIGLQSMALSQAEAGLVSSGDISHTLRVRLTISLAQLESSSGMFSGSDSKADVGLRFAPYMTRWAMNTGGSSAFSSPRIFLAQGSSIPAAMKLEEASKQSGNEVGNLFNAMRQLARVAPAKVGTTASVGGAFTIEPEPFAQAVVNQHKNVAAGFAKQVAAAK